MQPNVSASNVTVVARSPGLRSGEVEVVVTLPTYKRPEQVLATLQSVIGQRTTRRFAVIVMENDAEWHAGADAVAPLFENGTAPGLLVIAHDRGNCCAYNAGWTTALAEFSGLRSILVIDDDEIAGPDWLETMCRSAEKLAADIVGGPQVPVFHEPGHEHWAEHPVFAPPYRETGVVPALYSSGNLLVARRVLDAMPRPFLDLSFNFTGGGDSDFLSRAAMRGFRLGWCAQAPVRETVPARRLQADWIRSRSLREGALSTRVEKRRRGPSFAARMRVAAKSLALLAASPVRGTIRFARTGSVANGLYPFYVAVGRLLAEFGYVNEQYRQAEKN